MFKTKCGECGHLHIFNKNTLKLYGWKYQCRKCGAINDFSEDIDEKGRLRPEKVKG